MSGRPGMNDREETILLWVSLLLYAAVCVAALTSCAPKPDMCKPVYMKYQDVCAAWLYVQ